MRQRKSTFEQQYYRYVAINEGCNCAELVIQDRQQPQTRMSLGTALRQLATRLFHLRPTYGRIQEKPRATSGASGVR